jgi:hypothetical protein
MREEQETNESDARFQKRFDDFPHVVQHIRIQVVDASNKLKFFRDPLEPRS